jgi:serine/threonine protein phosphatase PrpC
MFDAITTVDDRVGLGPGDALVFYTDGITEASDDLFGQARLRDLVRDHAGRPADDVADGVAMRTFGDGSCDHVAVVVVRVPDDLGEDPVPRVVTATGAPAEQLQLQLQLQLPGYPHGGRRPDEIV